MSTLTHDTTEAARVRTGAGLGFEINPDFLKKNLVEGEQYWG